MHSVVCSTRKRSVSRSTELDGYGFPTELAGLAHLKKEIVLLGVRDHLELWDRARWDEYLANKQPQYDEIAENALADPLSAASDPTPLFPQEGERKPVQPR